jgi:hypothetical protein
LTAYASPPVASALITRSYDPQPNRTRSPLSRRVHAGRPHGPDLAARGLRGPRRHATGVSVRSNRPFVLRGRPAGYKGSSVAGGRQRGTGGHVAALSPTP